MSEHFQIFSLYLTQSSESPSLSGLAVIAGIIAACLRRRAIGGWLLYFFLQVAIGCASVALDVQWRFLAPGAWEGQRGYAQFALGTLPPLAGLAATALVTYKLLSTREWQWAVVMRYTLFVYAMLVAAASLAPLMAGQEVSLSDLSGLAFPVAFGIYFAVSTRVRSVFLRHDWNEVVGRPCPIPSDPETPLQSPASPSLREG